MAGTTKISGVKPRTALVVIIRNEEKYLLEWVAYHTLLGFDEIVVYENESTDGTAKLCRMLQERGLIRYRPWPDPPPMERTGPQLPAYRHAAANSLAEWLCFLDADEFLVLEQDETVGDLIKRVGHQQMPIALSWKIFGSGGYESSPTGLVIERYVRCGGPEIAVNRHIKTLGPVQVLRAGAQVHIHGWVLASAQFYVDASGQPVEIEEHTFLTPSRWHGAWVNHYIVKSREDFEVKRARGKATHAHGDPAKYDHTVEGYFLQYDRNEMEDDTLRRRAARVRDVIAVWNL